MIFLIRSKVYIKLSKVINFVRIIWLIRLLKMGKKMITMSINEKTIKLNFNDVKKILSRKPRKYPNVPYFDSLNILKD